VTQLRPCEVSPVKVSHAAAPHLVMTKQPDTQVKATVHGYVVSAKASSVDAALALQQGHPLCIDVENLGNDTVAYAEPASKGEN